MRTRKFYHSLRFKITAGLLLPLLVTLSLFSYMQYANQRELLMQNLKVSATNAGEIVEGSLQHAMLIHDFSDVQQIVDGIVEQRGVRDLFLLDKQGGVVLSAGAQRAGMSMSLSDATCQACHRYEAASRNESVILTDQQGARVFRNVNAIENRAACQQCHDPQLDTTGVLITDSSMEGVDRQLAVLGRDSLLWSGGSILVILLIVNIMTSQMVVSRLEQFVKAITRFGQGDLGERVTIGGSDEIAELADSFNRMAEGLLEKQRLEQKLEDRTSALDKAELALQNLRRLVSSGPASTLQVVHELRSPAASMYQTLDVLLQGYGSGRFQDQVEMLSLVRDRARAMLAMVNDLLHLGAIRQAETEKKVGPVRLVDALWQVVPEMRIKATLKGLDLQLDVPDVVPPIGATEEQVRCLWANLIDNAIKYTDPGGTVRVHVTYDHGHVTGTVEDTGIGIAPQDMSRIFDEFYRAKNAKQVEPYGTGLGLSIVRRVVELHGGCLDVESELGTGTKFTFTLPKFEGASAEEA
jgi:signal transduction histidine kinase